jgi:metal-responsive CopG/Arc/MetJ family transcriptional regulator
MPRNRIISHACAGILVSVRLSPSIIELLDLLAERDGISSRSALIRIAVDNEISKRVSI